LNPNGWVGSPCSASGSCPFSSCTICGSYCGPGWCEKTCESESVCQFSVPPQANSCTDACCMKHDMCCGYNDSRDCNKNLVTCLNACPWAADCLGPDGWWHSATIELTFASLCVPPPPAPFQSIGCCKVAVQHAAARPLMPRRSYVLDYCCGSPCSRLQPRLPCVSAPVTPALQRPCSQQRHLPIQGILCPHAHAPGSVVTPRIAGSSATDKAALARLRQGSAAQRAASAGPSESAKQFEQLIADDRTPQNAFS
jgi:hypothetical protein